MCRPTILRRFPVALAALAAFAALAGCASTDGQIELRVEDLSGQTITVSELLASVDRVIVFLFTSTDCPISNRYAPEIRAIREQYVNRGVEFCLVYVDAAQPAREQLHHFEEFAYPGRAVRDVRHQLVRNFGATTTPEVAVVQRDGALVYLGRIDDRFVDFGKARREARVHDLVDALDGVLEDRSPTTCVRTKAVGCPIPPLEAKVR